MRNKGLQAGLVTLDPFEPDFDGGIFARVRAVLAVPLLVLVAVLVLAVAPAIAAAPATHSAPVVRGSLWRSVPFFPQLDITPQDTTVFLYEIDARHCTSSELISCGCARGVKACETGTIDGKMTTLCECNPSPGRARIDPNLQVCGPMIEPISEL